MTQRPQCLSSAARAKRAARCVGWRLQGGSECGAGLPFVGLGAVRQAEVEMASASRAGVLGCGVDDVAQMGHARRGVMAVAVGRHDEKATERETRRSVSGSRVKGVVQGGAGRREKVALFEHAGDMGGAAHEMIGEAHPGGGLIRQAFGSVAGGGDGAAGVAAFGEFLGGGLERRNGRQLLTGR